MELLMLILIAVGFAAFAAAASDVGVDSRDGSDDPHRPNYPVGIA
jgi:hypothetical protein